MSAAAPLDAFARAMVAEQKAMSVKRGDLVLVECTGWPGRHLGVFLYTAAFRGEPAFVVEWPSRPEELRSDLFKDTEATAVKFTMPELRIGAGW